MEVDLNQDTNGFLSDGQHGTVWSSTAFNALLPGRMGAQPSLLHPTLLQWSLL